MEETMTHKRDGKQQFAERPLDEVEWELVRADVAHLKAEQEKSGDRQKWETDRCREASVEQPVPRWNAGLARGGQRADRARHECLNGSEAGLNV
jgi:hypothetical protein